MGRQEDQVRRTGRKKQADVGRQEDQVRRTGRKKQTEWAGGKIR